jgi:hypothetical protein
MIESSEEFVRLRTSFDPEECRRATNEAAPDAVWLEVISRHVDMRKWVAHNKSVGNSILRYLATDPDIDVRWTVAGRRLLDEEIMRTLASDSDDSVRLRIAQNSAAPEGLLRDLLADTWEEVRLTAERRLFP